MKKVESNYATPWKPEPGHKLTGSYHGTEEIPDGKGSTFTVHRLKTAEGWRSVSGAGLASILIQIPNGASIELEFLGMQKMANGRTVKDFAVLVDDKVALLDRTVTRTSTEVAEGPF